MSSYIPAALRRLVYKRAQNRCEYCLLPDSVVLVSHEIDHVIARKHGGRTKVDNLALSCTLCNKYKGSDLTSIDPETGAVVLLYHPRRDRWGEHFQLDGARIIPRTPTGRATTRLLQLNRSERLAERELLILAGAIHIPD